MIEKKFLAASAGCDKPAQVCAEPATTQAITKSLHTHTKMSGGLFLGSNSSNVIDRLFGTDPAKYDLVAFTGKDDQTKRITCSARVAFTMQVPAVASQPPTTATTDPIDIHYCRQPSADEATYIYTVDQADRIAKSLIDSVATVGLALNQLKAQAAAQAAQVAEQPLNEEVGAAPSANEKSASSQSDNRDTPASTEDNSESDAQ